MAQQGQVFPLAGHGQDAMRWAYRYRLGGRGSRRVQGGGFASEQAALERTLERMRREQGLVEMPTLVEFLASWPQPFPRHLRTQQTNLERIRRYVLPLLPERGDLPL